MPKMKYQSIIGHAKGNIYRIRRRNSHGCITRSNKITKTTTTVSMAKMNIQFWSHTHTALYPQQHIQQIAARGEAIPSLNIKRNNDRQHEIKYQLKQRHWLFGKNPKSSERSQKATQSYIDAIINTTLTQQSTKLLHYGTTMVVFLFDLILLLLK